MKAYYQQRLDPTNTSHWIDLLDYALLKTDTLEVAYSIRITKGLNREILRCHDYFLSYKILSALQGRYFSNRRWQKLYHSQTLFFRFDLTTPVIHFINSIPTLRQWLPVTGRLEDPALYKAKQPLLWAISHANIANILLPKELANEWEAEGFRFERMNGTQNPTNFNGFEHEKQML